VTASLAKATIAAAALLSFFPTAQAATVVGGSDLLTLAYAAQMETWLTTDPQLSYSGPLTFTNIYDKATGDTSANFHAAVDGKGPTFFVVEATSVASGSATQIIGGYNPRSWMSSGDYVLTPNVADRIAFIFYLISTMVLQQEAATLNGQYQSLNGSGYGPAMGAGSDIYINSALGGGSVQAYSYCLDPASSCYPGGPNVLGGTGGQNITVGKLEVFTISAAAVPVPAAAPLLLGALGLTGWIARRRKG
jgi:hypothetical protein